MPEVAGPQPGRPFLLRTFIHTDLILVLRFRKVNDGLGTMGRLFSRKHALEEMEAAQ